MSIRIISSTEVVLTYEDHHRLFEIMRIAYASTEVEIWGENYTRISEEEYIKLIVSGQITVAYYGDDIAGCNWVYKRNDTSHGYGLLATHMDFTKKGIGKALVENAELTAKNAGASFMDIEILRPRGIDVPSKIILQKWYESMGYEYVYSEDFALRKPDKAKRLVAPSDFDCYRKTL
ncbi:MAG: GNAT superfamily N-acetyltransferase [Flavobacteriaceae bacterium]|jgi:GNAT superfamily N-acetyltransferase